MLVDTDGRLWLHTRYQHYEDHGTTSYRRRFLVPVSAANLYRWDVANWELFARLEKALERF